jgi:hypothetical protein
MRRFKPKIGTPEGAFSALSSKIAMKFTEYLLVSCSQNHPLPLLSLPGILRHAFEEGIRGKQTY